MDGVTGNKTCSIVLVVRTFTFLDILHDQVCHTEQNASGDN